MTDDLSFAPTEQRAAPPADRISLRDHVVAAEIGAFQSERGRPQRLRFNVVVEVPAPSAPLADDVDRILSYDTLAEAIAAALAEARVDLLETLAERIAHRILAAPQAQRCLIRIEKLDRGPGALGVEIVRAALPGRDAAEAAPHPLIVHLSTAAIASPRLGAWLDELAGQGAILCVGMPQAPVPEAGAAAAQRRIELLAIEQSAWVLAARDPRCVVAGTRTELDWAIRQRRLAVWAPNKVVRDAADPFAGALRDAGALTAWFARLMDAGRVIFVGAPPPEGLAAETRPADAATLL